MLRRRFAFHSCTDSAWLDTLNDERDARGEPPISQEVFEEIIDRLEKEWFNLVRRLGWLLQSPFALLNRKD
jgi:hypothetical protein